MKKIFSKKIFGLAGVTYLVSVIAYLVGYNTHSDSGGLIDLGPEISGLGLAIVVFLGIIIIFCLYILIKVKPKSLIFGYLILTFGIIYTVLGSMEIVKEIRRHETIQEQSKINNLKI